MSDVFEMGSRYSAASAAGLPIYLVVHRWIVTEWRGLPSDHDWSVCVLAVSKGRGDVGRLRRLSDIAFHRGIEGITVIRLPSRNA